MTCPICDRMTNARYRPFCSRRCADVDLGKWLTGSYTLPQIDEDHATADPVRNTPSNH